MKPEYVTDPKKLGRLSPETLKAVEKVTEQFAFRANEYYLSLINWDDPNDPIRKIIIPNPDELQQWGALDPSCEHHVTPIKGVQHKYPYTILLLCNETCGGFCRFCFRKRLFMNVADEISMDVSAGLEYIRAQTHITNVLLTGGDPLLLSTARLRGILEALREIPHVQIIRIGSKMPAFNPWRILDDPELQAVFRQCSTPRKRIYLMVHFDHPRELSDVAIEGVDCLLRNGVILCNQCPIIGGVNDDVEVMVELFRKLSFAGVAPYYVFQGRPTVGNRCFAVPIVRGFELFEEAKKRISGLAKRARFVMSHASGKIEIVGVDAAHIYMRYHCAKDPANEGKFMIFRRKDDAYWLDDLLTETDDQIVTSLSTDKTLADRAKQIEKEEETSGLADANGPE
jgi:KamA family protein